MAANDSIYKLDISASDDSLTIYETPNVHLKTHQTFDEWLLKPTLQIHAIICIQSRIAKNTLALNK